MDYDVTDEVNRLEQLLYYGTLYPDTFKTKHDERFVYLISYMTLQDNMYTTDILFTNKGKLIKIQRYAISDHIIKISNIEKTELNIQVSDNDVYEICNLTMQPHWDGYMKASRRFVQYQGNLSSYYEHVNKCFNLIKDKLLKNT